MDVWIFITLSVHCQSEHRPSSLFFSSSSSSAAEETARTRRGLQSIDRTRHHRRHGIFRENRQLLLLSRRCVYRQRKSVRSICHEQLASLLRHGQARSDRRRRRAFRSNSKALIVRVQRVPERSLLRLTDIRSTYSPIHLLTDTSTTTIATTVICEKYCLFVVNSI